MPSQGTEETHHFTAPGEVHIGIDSEPWSRRGERAFCIPAMQAGLASTFALPLGSGLDFKLRESGYSDRIFMAAHLFC